MKRKTIKNAFVIEGIGLHKGEKSKLIFRPQLNSNGINFLNPFFLKPIKASPDNVHSTLRGTNLTNGKDIVYTVEHILSALLAFEIDDIDIEIYGNEPPSLDGSAKLYADFFKKNGIIEKENTQSEYYKFEKELEFSENGSYYKICDSDKFEIECLFENPHPLIKTQKVAFKIDPEIYEKDIAPARTFGFEEEVEFLRKNNLALGGSLENAIVLSKTGILNKEPLRFGDEFVRHKVLDILGDLKLLGKRFKNIKISAIKPSHENNVKFVKFLRGV